MTIDDRMRTRFEVEEFLIREADLLDDQRYADWFALLTDDLFYWAPAIESVERRHRATNRIGEAGETAYFEDDRATIGMRIARLGFPGAWAEVPPSRTRHYITNITVDAVEGDEIAVRSNFFVFRSRLEMEEDQYFGRREDRLRRADSGLQLARRKIIFSQSVLTSRSITTFF